MPKFIIPQSAPRLPTEVVREILSWAVRPQLQFEKPHRDRMESTFLFDRSKIRYAPYSVVSSLSRTSATFRSVVKELCSQQLAIRSSRELLQYLTFFTECVKGLAPLCPGSRTTSIEVSLPGRYNADELVEVLQNTPNLRTLVIGVDPECTTAERVPEIVIRAIASYLPRIKHLYFNTVSSSPSFEDVLTLLKSLKSIHTLHVQNLCSSPDLSDFMASPQPAVWTTSLRTLSLGVINHPSANPRSSIRIGWDKLVIMLTRSDIRMPFLQELVIPMFPSSPAFFNLYGSQIKTIHTTSFFSRHVLAPALKLCPSVAVLSIELCDEIPCFPDVLPSLKALHILPCIEGICGGSTEHVGYHSCPVKLDELMEEVLATGCPELKVVAVHTVEAFFVPSIRQAFVTKRRGKWERRGISLIDGYGTIWLSICSGVSDRNSMLLGI